MFRQAGDYLKIDSRSSGEAKEADIGIAGGDGCGLLFKKGEIVRKVPENEIVNALMEEIENL